MGEVEVKALDDISLSIQKGGIVSIVGPSGSGKTTLLNLIGALDYVDKGNIEIDGQKLSTLTEKELSYLRREIIGYVFQNFNLLEEINAEKKKYGYIFELHVEGTLNNPVKEIKIFDAQTREDLTHLYPETKDQIALLIFGVTFSELGSDAGSIMLDKGGEVLSQALISQIERETRHFVGLDEIRV